MEATPMLSAQRTRTRYKLNEDNLNEIEGLELLTTYGPSTGPTAGFVDGEPTFTVKFRIKLTRPSTQ